MNLEYKPRKITQYLKNGTKQVILSSQLSDAMNDNINTEKITIEIEIDQTYNHQNCINVRSGAGEYTVPKFNTRFEI